MGIFNLQYPILGLSPMDGVSDNAFRFITKKYGNPDLIYTEFEHVTGICMALENVISTFDYEELERPILGQIYGTNPEHFYHAAKVVCALGFDGVDINMGCPAKNVASSGAGAGLIKTFDLAREIIAAVKEGVAHWVENGEITGLRLKAITALSNKINEKILSTTEANFDSIGLKNLKSFTNKTIKREIIPVSVKTRIGYDKPVTADWIKNLSEESPHFIALHGRTLKQMYGGKADWKEIKIAVDNTQIPILANGDINTREDFLNAINTTGAKGALIGRATFGNPSIFKELRGESVEKSEFEKSKILLQHAKFFFEKTPTFFYQMRKHFGWYIKSFDNAKEVREKLVRSNSLNDVTKILEDFGLLKS